MSILFISDLHLQPDEPQTIHQAVNLLQQYSAQLSALYILGDLFNTWLGDDITPEAYRPLTQQLSRMAQQDIACYLMVGNRDFMLGKAFAQRCHLTLLTDPTTITLGTTSVLLMHGDSLCSDDIAYQRYRKWSRNRCLQWLFLRLSKKRRQAISDLIKHKSRQQKKIKSAQIMDVNHNTVSQIMNQQQADFLIHGHTHRPAIHQLSPNKCRFVLGDWCDEPSYALYHEGTISLYDPRCHDSIVIH